MIEWLRDKLKDRIKRFLDIFMIILFDLTIFCCLLLAFRFAVFLTGCVFSEETAIISIAKTVSYISAIGSYIVYTVFDLFWYIRKSFKEQS